MPLDLVRTADILPERVCDIVLPCRACCYWEYPECCTRGKHTDEEAQLKAEWFEEIASHFQPCGKVLYADGESAAYCQCAPPKHLPGISNYPGLASQLDRDGVFISCLYVSQKHQRKGLGSRLLQELVDDLTGRGVAAVETFARNDSTNNCSGPTQFYLARAFAVVATESYSNGASFSLVRLELTRDMKSAALIGLASLDA